MKNHNHLELSLFSNGLLLETTLSEFLVLFFFLYKIKLPLSFVELPMAFAITFFSRITVLCYS